MKPSRRSDYPGPFRADSLKPGDRYELSDGHAIYCAPAGGRHGRKAGAGYIALEFDPDATETGLDTGFAPHPGTLRAPDVAVGNIPDAPGWVQGVPLLALEYADTGQDEVELQAKIRDLAKAGTDLIWVVRLVGSRRVEVYERGTLVRVAVETDELTAPGILRNPVPVLALYERQAAHQVALRNLLQRQGYESLDAVRVESRTEGLTQGRTEGLTQGRAEGTRAALRRAIARRGFALSPELDQLIKDETDQSRLDSWLDDAATATTVADIFR